MPWTVSLPSRYGVDFLLTPTHEAQRLLDGGDWTVVPTWRALELLDDPDGPGASRALALLDRGPDWDRPTRDRAQLRRRLTDALLPAPEGRGSLRVLCRNRAAMDADGGITVTPLTDLLRHVA